jgi:hypothetical protein
MGRCPNSADGTRPPFAPITAASQSCDRDLAASGAEPPTHKEWHARGGHIGVPVADGLSPSTDSGFRRDMPRATASYTGPLRGQVLLSACGFVGGSLVNGDRVAFIDSADLVVDDGADPDQQERADDDPPGGVDVDA